MKIAVETDLGPQLDDLKEFLQTVQELEKTTKGLHFLTVDEIVEKNSNTQEMCNSIKRKYPLTTVYVYPDPTGRKRQTNAAVGQTDFDILRKNGFIVCSPSHPYATKDKFNTVNAALCNANNIRKVFIAKNKCPQLKKAFEGYAYKENGDTDKSSGLDHISDAASYLICYKLPMYGSRRVQKPSVLGV